jgi:hypothetical protein
MLKILLTILLFVLGITLALALGGGLLVLLAYGVGWLLNLVMHLDPFQATVLSLAGICVFGFLAERIWQVVINPPPLSREDEYDDEEFDDEEFDYDEDEDEEEEEEEPVIYPGVPRWRQPLKSPDFSNTKPDDRCPCGSGRKYKNCHGTKQSK